MDAMERRASQLEQELREARAEADSAREERGECEARNVELTQKVEELKGHVVRLEALVNKRGSVFP
jgi:chromosome segregation ATPase